MESISEFFHMITTTDGFGQLIAMGGYAILFAIIFAETGLLVGFFLPGDSLLVTAGLLAANNQFGMDIVVLNALLIPAAVLGDALGYTIGRRMGDRLYNRPNSRFFKREHLDKTREFYAKHGGRTIVIARFVPVVRTFAPVVAGAAKMPYREFAGYNIAGGVLWIASMTLTGFFLGNIPGVSEKLHLVIIGVILLSIVPIVIEFVKHRMRRRSDVTPQDKPLEPGQ